MAKTNKKLLKSEKNLLKWHRKCKLLITKIKNNLQSNFIATTVNDEENIKKNNTDQNLIKPKIESHDRAETKAEVEANKAKIQIFKKNQKVIKKLTNQHSKAILTGKIVSIANNNPDPWS